MKIRLKRLHEQTIVITGATSGIGLVTARLAAHAGCRIVLASRNEGALKMIAQELNGGPFGSGHQAAWVVADMGDPGSGDQIAKAAIEAFGGFDTWVNNAGVSIYGRLEEVPFADARRMFDTTYWGVVHGSMAALRHFRSRGLGGRRHHPAQKHPPQERLGAAIINVGSTGCDLPVPLQGYYCAAKHAVKAFTEVLRMELEHELAAVGVTLIKPGSVDTPFVDHAKNYMSVEPKYAPPITTPQEVAKAILHCAREPEREVSVNAGGVMMTLMGHLPHAMTERMLERTMFKEQRSDRPVQGRHADHSLYEAGRDLQERHVDQRRVEGGTYQSRTAPKLYTGGHD